MSFFSSTCFGTMRLRRHTLFLICLRLIINFIPSSIIIYTINHINQTLICQFKKNSLIYLCYTVHNEHCYVRASICIYLLWNYIKATHRKKTARKWIHVYWRIDPTAAQLVNILKIKRNVNVLRSIVVYISKYIVKLLVCL